MADNRTESTRRSDSRRNQHRRDQHRRKQNLHVDNDRRSIVDRREGDPAKIYASSEYARKALNWSAKHSSLENIIETTWRIYK